MDYETFDRLHKRDPLLFSLAMEIFLDKGRIAVQQSSNEELTIAILHRMTQLLMEKNLRTAIESTTAFARLDTGTLLNYAKRSGYYIGGGEAAPAADDPF